MKIRTLYIVNNMSGDINVVSIDLKDLGSRFKTAELFGKLANIGDDIGDKFIADAAVLRKLATGERINVERKGQDPFDFFNYAALLFSVNAVSRIRDKTGAIQRRIVIVPFDAKFTPDDAGYNSTLRYDLSQQEHTEYLIVLALAGLKRALANQRFTEPQRVKAANKEYGFLESCPDRRASNRLETSVSSLLLFADAYGIIAARRLLYLIFGRAYAHDQLYHVRFAIMV